MDISMGGKIKNLRLSKKMTQKELCGDKLNRVILSRIENNKMIPSLLQIEYIASRLGKNTDYFLSSISYNADMENAGIWETDSELEELFEKKMYYNIVKLEEISSIQGNRKNRSYNKDYYLGMSYFNLDMPFIALKPLRRYMNLYFKSQYGVQEIYIINFLNTLNTLFKVMLRNKNYGKCETYLLTGRKYIYEYKVDSSQISFVIHNNLAYLYLKQCRYEDIINLLEPFLDSHKEMQPIFAAAWMYLSLNIACYNLGLYEKSITYIKKTIYLYLYLGKDYDAGESYFNYFNALRYSENYEEASLIVDRCLQDFRNHEILYNRFMVQKMLLLFNTGHYDEVLHILKKVDKEKLPKISKCNLYFILGHIEYENRAYQKALRYFSKCEGYFIKKKYFDDLYILYKDMWSITGDEQYMDEAEKCINQTHKRKNITVNI